MIAKKIILLNTGEIFNYIKLAYIKYGIHRDSIRKCCQNKFKYAGKLEDGTKLVWMYYANYINAKKMKKAICNEKRIKFYHEPRGMLHI